MLLFRNHLVSVILLAAAQAPSTSPTPNPPLSWASVAIHETDPGKATDGYSHDQPNGISEHAMSLKDFISEGYNMSVMPLRDDEIIGLPDWAKTTRYDILARVDPDDVDAFRKLSNLSMQETIAAFNSRQPTGEMLMIQSILAERFHLRVHWETRDRSIYAITLARGGLRMKSAGDPEHGEMTFARGHLSGKGVPLSFLASLLEIPTERTVIDTTGVSGAFDFDLHFDPHDSSSTESNDPDFFTAVQEQLGIKLQSTHAPVRVLVVDHVDPPTAN